VAIGDTYEAPPGTRFPSGRLSEIEVYVDPAQEERGGSGGGGWWPFG